MPVGGILRISNLGQHWLFFSSLFSSLSHAILFPFPLLAVSQDFSVVPPPDGAWVRYAQQQEQLHSRYIPTRYVDRAHTTLEPWNTQT